VTQRHIQQDRWYERENSSVNTGVVKGNNKISDDDGAICGKSLHNWYGLRRKFRAFFVH